MQTPQPRSSAQPGMPPWRLKLLTLALLAGFGAIGWKLTDLGRDGAITTSLMASGSQIQHAVSRPDIVDRNGRMLASDIKVYWLFADPAEILDVDETVERLSRLLPAQDMIGLAAKLRSKSRFEWVKRGLSPKMAARVHNLGLPGLHLIEEPQRIYPAGRTAAHILGHANVDNQGLAGIEKHIDDAVKSAAAESETGEPERSDVRLSIDLRVQHALYGELAAAQKRYDAKAVGGLVLNIRTGEVLGMAALPSYDPNDREQALIDGRHNRFYYDAYELGSVFKSFAVALALEEGLAGLEDQVDVLTPIRIGRFTLRDRHAKTQYLTLREVFTHSSNTGAARLALSAGGDRLQAFFSRLGLMDPASTELGPTARPLFPDPWREVNTMTAAYGHGFSVPPFAFAVASAALINGGYKIQPTFFPRSYDETGPGERILSEETSKAMRHLFWENVETGTGRQAKVSGYRVGGKTGTAWKPVKGGYSKENVITSFVGAFPMDAPRYLTLVVIDEPKPEEAGKRTEAGHNAAPTSGALIKRIAPMLGVAPLRRFDVQRQASY